MNSSSSTSSSSSGNLQTLSILLERAESERDEALRLLQDAQLRAQLALTQAQELTQYRVDYQQRWGQQFRSQSTMDIVGCYQNFGGKLDQAIDSQSVVASHAEVRVTRARELLVEKEMRVAALTKLIERRRQEQGRNARRQEQKATDEQAARASLAASNPFARLGV
jgi:flagellar FliJ protein